MAESALKRESGALQYDRFRRGRRRRYPRGRLINVAKRWDRRSPPTEEQQFAALVRAVKDCVLGAWGHFDFLTPETVGAHSKVVVNPR